MRHLVIKNVGPIDYVDIELSRFNFFIGPQSSGKSTIAKVLSTCMWLEKEAASTMTKRLSYTSEEFVSLLEEYHKIQKYISPDSFITYETDSATVHYDRENALTVVLKEGFPYQRQKVSYIPAERSAITIPELQGFEFGVSNMRSFLFDWYTAREMYDPSHKAEVLNLDMKYFYDKDEKKYKDRVEHSNGKTYEISLSSASSGLQALIPLQLMVQYYTDAYFSQYDIKTAFDDNKKDQILRARLTDEIVLKPLYKYDYSDEERRNLIREVNERIQKGDNEAQETLQKFRVVHDQLAVPVRTSFVIEEPEENLYPYSQISLIEMLVKCCQNERKHEMVVTTHSPYVINYLNVLLRGSRSGVRFEPEDIKVWAVSEGHVMSLNAKDTETGEMIIDTYDLTEPMEEIFGEFKGVESYEELVGK